MCKASGGRWLGLAGLATLASCADPTQPAPGEMEPVFSADSAQVRVAAGAQYARRGWWWRHLWGEHYRRQWAVPVTVPVLRLGAVELQPGQVGGSFQTNSLHLRTPDGRAFVLRSVDKDLSRSISNEHLRSFVGPVLRDQTCAAPPYGAYVASALARATGVYHTNPRLVYLRPDSVLGDLRKEFKPALYLLEERPNRDQSHAPSVGRSELVVGSTAMLLATHARPTAHIAARAYLRARLLDMVLGDWSRRADQWRWAAFEEPGGRAFRAIPRDRDQAFFRFDDGWLTRFISWVRPRYQSFAPTLEIAAVDPLTITARPLDQTALALLTEVDFQAEADSVVRRLPEAVLTQSLQMAPAEARPLLARELLPPLRARRDALPAAAARFYQVLQQDAVLAGTDAPERFVLTALGPGRVQVQVWARPAGRPDSLRGQHTYDVRHTRRLRLYGLGGNDEFELRGALAPGFAVWLDGGRGTNSFRQASPAGTVGVGFTVAVGPHDAVVLGPVVRRRAVASATADAASWVSSQYRLRVGK
ncbi:hypothetical protein GO988_04670 [Hymenobacter sp. HMF4947]|uniref:Uncharacterized protein n=1 Tax=Hymenobacter ginkgonis TaxID=2682976 RepID=A0A7K1TB53_9BACT|nr:hypothetical protein [Hymenobacter ginkgonis]MVN75613.1 hypothetical protein [Hymenobacter ginkgonis]